MLYGLLSRMLGTRSRLAQASNRARLAREVRRDPEWVPVGGYPDIGGRHRIKNPLSVFRGYVVDSSTGNTVDLCEDVSSAKCHERRRQ